MSPRTSEAWLECDMDVILWDPLNLNIWKHKWRLTKSHPTVNGSFFDHSATGTFEKGIIIEAYNAWDPNTSES